MNFRFTGSRWYQKTFWSLIPPMLAPYADQSETPHSTVLVRDIELDGRIAELVWHCWSLGLKTLGSCQGDAELYTLFSSRHPSQWGAGMNPHAAHICFETATEGLQFKRIVDRFVDQSVSELQLVIGKSDYCFANFHPQALVEVTAALDERGQC